MSEYGDRLEKRLIDTQQELIEQLQERLACATSFEKLNGPHFSVWHIFKRSETEWVLTTWNYSGERVYKTQDEAFAQVEGARL